MTAKRLALLAALLSLTVPAFAAQRGGAGQSGRGSGQGQQMPRAGGQSSSGAATRQRDAERYRLRKQATDPQRKQFRTCDRLLDRIHADTTELQRLAAGPNHSAKMLRRQRDQLRQQMRTLEKENARLMASLNREQRAAVRDHERTMRLIQEHSHVRLRDLDNELARPSPNAARVSSLAREMRQETNRWRTQNREMGNSLGLNFGSGKEP